MHDVSENMWEDEDDRVIRPNKSQLKRDALELLALGKKLSALDLPFIQRLKMPDELRQALFDSKNITQNGAKKRHYKFLGRILRDIDTELLEKTIEELEFGTAKANAKFHMIERWRSRLLDVEDGQALTEWMNTYPNSDASQIRQLLRNAQKELSQNKPLKSSRNLFKVLRDVVQNQSNQNPSPHI